MLSTGLNINEYVGSVYCNFLLDTGQVLRCVIPVVCRKTNSEVNISHETTTVVVWIYDGI